MCMASSGIITGGHVVEKELIASFSFPKEEVLSAQEERVTRDNHIQLAVQLGNNFKHKVKIVFVDSEGEKCVETTIWMATPHFISLKTGTILPVQRIKEVRLF